MWDNLEGWHKCNTSKYLYSLNNNNTITNMGACSSYKKMKQNTLISKQSNKELHLQPNNVATNETWHLYIHIFFYKFQLWSRWAKPFSRESIVLSRYAWAPVLITVNIGQMSPLSNKGHIYYMYFECACIVWNNNEHVPVCLFIQNSKSLHKTLYTVGRKLLRVFYNT